jgi:hypothetical protein
MPLQLAARGFHKARPRERITGKEWERESVSYGAWRQHYFCFHGWIPQITFGCIAGHTMQGHKSQKQPALISVQKSLHVLHIGTKGVMFCHSPRESNKAAHFLASKVE